MKSYVTVLADKEANAKNLELAKILLDLSVYTNVKKSFGNSIAVALKKHIPGKKIVDMIKQQFEHGPESVRGCVNNDELVQRIINFN